MGQFTGVIGPHFFNEKVKPAAATVITANFTLVPPSPTLMETWFITSLYAEAFMNVEAEEAEVSASGKVALLYGGDLVWQPNPSTFVVPAKQGTTFQIPLSENFANPIEINRGRELVLRVEAEALVKLAKLSLNIVALTPGIFTFYAQQRSGERVL